MDREREECRKTARGTIESKRGKEMKHGRRKKAKESRRKNMRMKNAKKNNIV